MTSWPVIAITSGEPAGIGPEICLRLIERQGLPVHFVVLGDRQLLADRALLIDFKGKLRDWTPGVQPEHGTLDILHIALSAPSLPGQLDPANASYVLQLLDRAQEGCQSGEFAAMVTAPVH